MHLINKSRNLAFVIDPRNTDSSFPISDQFQTTIAPLSQISDSMWRQIHKLQGFWRVFYLRLRYGGPATYVLVAFQDKQLVHIEWLVPYEKMRRHYPFVTPDSYSIIACLTASNFRGKGVYPTQLHRAVTSGLSEDQYWIWATIQNEPSLRGIRKAGGREMGMFTKTKLLFGLLSRICYTPKEENEHGG